MKKDKSDAILYAHWEEFCYTIRFDANGGTGIMGYMALKYSDSAALSANKFTKEGYEFR